MAGCSVPCTFPMTLGPLLCLGICATHPCVSIPDLDLHWEFAGGGHLLTINGTGCDLGRQQVVWVISEASHYAWSSHRYVCS